MLVSIAMATLVVLIATQNIIVTFFCISAVIFIVSDITGAMVLLNWELGIAESVSIVIAIGFAVDYVVHLAAHYVHSPYYNHNDKATESLTAMGVSIYSGAITTLGSAVFQFGGTIIFF